MDLKDTKEYCCKNSLCKILSLLQEGDKSKLQISYASYQASITDYMNEFYCNVIRPSPCYNITCE